jgi:hypothetical protein
MGAVESVPVVTGCAPSTNGGGTKEENLKQSLNAIRKLKSDEERRIAQLSEEAATPSFGKTQAEQRQGAASMTTGHSMLCTPYGGRWSPSMSRRCSQLTMELSGRVGTMEAHWAVAPRAAAPKPPRVECTSDNPDAFSPGHDSSGAAPPRS